MYYKDDDRGLLVVEQLLGRRLEQGESEAAAWELVRTQLAAYLDSLN